MNNKQINQEHPLNNHVIFSLNDEHGANIIKWWKKQGINTSLCGNLREGYGLYCGEFASFPDEDIERNNLKVVTLPNPLMDYCIKGTYDEVAPIYDSIGINTESPVTPNKCKDILCFYIDDDCMNFYILGFETKIKINIDQAKQMIEEFYAPEPKSEVKEDKPTYPYLAKVWNANINRYKIGLVVYKIEAGKPISPYCVAIGKDIIKYINGIEYISIRFKNAEPINHSQGSILNEQAIINKNIESLKAEIRESSVRIELNTSKIEVFKERINELDIIKEAIELL